MINIKTISKYIAQQFLLSFLLVVSVISSVVMLVDSVELIRRSYGKGLLIFKILAIVLLRLPNIIQEILPFICFISSMICYYKLSKNSELVVLRSSGISAWQFIMPAFLSSILIGSLNTIALSPLTSNMFVQSEIMEDKMLRSNSTVASAFSSGIWLKDNVPEFGNIIINASYISGNSSELRNVTFYFYGDDFEFIKRVDSEVALLNGNTWRLINAKTSSKNNIAKKSGVLDIKTNINIEKLQDSFAKPSNLSFWRLPEFISNMQSAGLSASRHLQYYYHLIILPLLIGSMTMMAASFVIRVNSRSQNHIEILLGIISSFIIYFMTQLIYTMGLSGNLPIILSVISPTILCLCIGIFIILQREEAY